MVAHVSSGRAQLLLRRAREARGHARRPRASARAPSTGPAFLSFPEALLGEVWVATRRPGCWRPRCSSTRSRSGARWTTRVGRRIPPGARPAGRRPRRPRRRDRATRGRARPVPSSSATRTRGSAPTCRTRCAPRRRRPRTRAPTAGWRTSARSPGRCGMREFSGPRLPLPCTSSATRTRSRPRGPRGRGREPAPATPHARGRRSADARELATRSALRRSRARSLRGRRGAPRGCRRTRNSPVAGPVGDDAARLGARAARPRRRPTAPDPARRSRRTRRRPSRPGPGTRRPGRRRSSNARAPLHRREVAGQPLLAPEGEPGGHDRLLGRRGAHRARHPTAAGALPARAQPGGRVPAVAEERRRDRAGDRTRSSSTSATDTPTALKPWTKFVVPSSGSTTQRRPSTVPPSLLAVERDRRRRLAPGTPRSRARSRRRPRSPSRRAGPWPRPPARVGAALDAPRRRPRAPRRGPARGGRTVSITPCPPDPGAASGARSPAARCRS